MFALLKEEKISLGSFRVFCNCAASTLTIKFLISLPEGSVAVAKKNRKKERKASDVPHLYRSFTKQQGVGKFFDAVFFVSCVINSFRSKSVRPP
jgi:hypothetical protein